MKLALALVLAFVSVSLGLVILAISAFVGYSALKRFCKSGLRVYGGADNEPAAVSTIINIPLPPASAQLQLPITPLFNYYTPAPEEIAYQQPQTRFTQ